MTDGTGFDQVRRQVFDAAQRLLQDRGSEYRLTHAEIASATGLGGSEVLRALEVLDGEHLDVSFLDERARAEVRAAKAPPP